MGDIATRIAGVKQLGQEKDRVIFEVASGHSEFETRL